jgi:hypothetical protein
MKRITIGLDEELLVPLKLDAALRGITVAAVIRDPLRLYLGAKRIPPGAGAFRSGRKTTANRAEEEHRETRFPKE